MKFVVDVCLSPEWVDFLVSAGHEARHWSELGLLDAPDSEVLLGAKESQAILFTHDLDFGAILAATAADGPSVLQLREQNTDPEIVGPAVLSAIEQCRDQLDSGALVTVDLRRSKARVLPLRKGE